MAPSNMTVAVAYATPNTQIECPVEVPLNCSVAVAVKRSGLLEKFPEIPWPQVIVGIYAKKVSLDAPLKPGDRVEIYRPLQIDPKEARQRRVQASKS